MADRDALDEEDAIRDYFRKGLTYDEILEFFDKQHGIEMSVVTLKWRIKEYGLKTRNGNQDNSTVRVKIRSLLVGSGSIGQTCLACTQAARYSCSLFHI